MTNRRSGRRNQFYFKESTNSITVVVCIIITIISVMTTVIVLVKDKKKIPADNSIVVNTENINDNKIKISNEDIVKINNVISFLNSNVDFGDSITDDNTKYYLTCKYYNIKEKTKIIPQDSIKDIEPDTYRKIGYMYFDDLKEEYMYISFNDFITTYNKLFISNNDLKKIYSDFYIESIDGIVVPKNLLFNDSKQYKILETESNNNELYVTMQEVDLYKLYKEKTYEEILEYLNNPEIYDQYSGNSIIKIKMILENGNYVFEKYFEK